MSTDHQAHGPEDYERPTIVELGSLLELTQMPTGGKTISTPDGAFGSAPIGS